uniref:Protein EARLY FLOWERING 4 domain-containing protein n=1 Tax=Ananas comosus var. bracteatus TaxID=296719 RepID=A0A6V7NK12_ANACO|nr:unnamed protein product [Ananas comosus var. bracteatus]
MLCGLLLSADVLRIGVVFASGLLRAVRFLRLHWPQLCHDLSTETLSPAVVTDPPSARPWNVGLIRELNRNIRMVVDLYADLSTSLGRSVAASSEGDSTGTLKSGCKAG